MTWEKEEERDNDVMREKLKRREEECIHLYLSLSLFHSGFFLAIRQPSAPNSDNM